MLFLPLAVSSSTFAIRLALGLALALLPALVCAQPAIDDAQDARIHLGPVALDPRLSIGNVGVDTNVFNQANTPVRDFTITAGPQLDSWFRVGRLAWAGTSSASWTYFRRTATERTFNAGQSGRVQLDLGYVVPFAQGVLERGRQRPNLEIDARVRRDMTIASGGLDLLMGPRTTVTLEYGERDFRYGDVDNEGLSFARTLDRREELGTVRGRVVLTPLTSIAVEATSRRDRFRFSPERNGESAAITGAVEFRPLALIAGRAVVGVRRFDPVDAEVPDYTGVVSDVELSYQLRDLTRFVVTVRRDLDYSFESLQAYYVSTGTRLSLVQALGASWDVIGHVGRTDLDYRARTGGAVAEAGRSDLVTVYGLGLGRRLGTDIRVGLDVEYASRDSNVPIRAYEGLRGGGSFSYGF